MNDDPKRPGRGGKDGRDDRRAPRGGGPREGSGGPRKSSFSRDGKPGRAGRPREAEPVEAEQGERIAKRLARAGIASRRDAEALISAGRVAVNGRLLDSPALNVGPGDAITIDGQPIPEIERTRLFLFHKPAGIVTTNRDPEGRRTVFDALPSDLPRLMTVGRLDINTEGLLLLTNDGGLARVLELPATGWLRRYRVRVHGRVDEQRLAALKDGVAVDGVFYGAVEASLDREQGSNAWLTIGLREGKNREVKNILGSLGLDVTRLIRVSYGPFQLGELPEGAVQELKGRMLRDQLGDRLIEESGAIFDAPIAKPFPNRPVIGSSASEQADRGAARDTRQDEPGEGGLIRNRKRSRDDKRENALGRLSTRPDRDGPKGSRGRDDGGKKGRFGSKPAREERAPEPRRLRSANVWMAPGARPVGERTAEEDETAAAPERADKPQRRPRPEAPMREESGARSRRSDATGARPVRHDGKPRFEKKDGSGEAPRFRRREDRSSPASAGDTGGEGRFQKKRYPPRDPGGAANDERSAQAPRPGKAERAAASARFDKRDGARRDATGEGDAPRPRRAFAGDRPERKPFDGPRKPRPEGSGDGGSGASRTRGEGDAPRPRRAFGGDRPERKPFDGPRKPRPEGSGDGGAGASRARGGFAGRGKPASGERAERGGERAAEGRAPGKSGGGKSFGKAKPFGGPAGSDKGGGGKRPFGGPPRGKPQGGPRKPAGDRPFRPRGPKKDG